MKSHNIEDLVTIIEKQSQTIEKQQKQIDKLVEQVSELQKNNTTKDINENKLDSSVSDNERLQEIEDVVMDMKGEMTELMLVYQDIQDKVFDIDRWRQRSSDKF